MKSSDVIITNRIYIPKKHIDLDLVKQHFEFEHYNENQCNACKIYKNGERHDEVCDSCPAYLGIAELWREVEVKNKTYIGLPPGQVNKVETLFKIDLSKADDRRPELKLHKDIKFTGKLFDGSVVDDRITVNQKKVVADWLAVKGGIIQVPPRGGKCLVGNTLVHTNKGLLPIKDLFSKNHKNGKSKKIDNLKVLTKDGYKQVSHIYKKKVNETIKITPDLGHTIEGTLIHPVLVLKPNLELNWVQLNDVQIGDYICASKNNGFSNKKSKKLELHLATLTGLLVANGSMNRKNYATFTSDNKKIQQTYIKCYYKVFHKVVKFTKPNNKTAYTRLAKNEINILNKLGFPLHLAANKYIPDYIMKGNKDAVKAFMSAYMSCDSYVSSTREIELSSASKKLINQIKTILSEFDIHGSYKRYHSYARNSNSPKEKVYYSIYYRGPSKEKLLTEFKWLKDVFYKPYINSGKYLTNAIPYVRNNLISFCRKYSKGQGVYIAEDKKVVKKLPFVAEGVSKNLIDRDNFNKVNWEEDCKFIEKLDVSLATNIRNLVKSDFIFTQVVKKQAINKSKNVYDLTVPDGHNFIANGIVVHNTTMAIYLIIKLGLRAVIIANKKTLLRQFYHTIVGSSTRKAITNVREVEKRLGRKLVGVVNKPSDFEGLQIAIVNYQKFIRNDKSIARIGKYINNKFSTLIIDECLPAKSIINTDQGDLTISEIVEKNIKCKVKSYNHKTKLIEYKEIMATMKNKTTKLIKISHEKGVLTCTPDHPVWVANKNRYILAKNLTPDDQVVFNR